MATSSVSSPVTRETPAFIFDRGPRKIIVTIRGDLIEMRCKGMKKIETLDVTSAFTYALKSRLAYEKAQKKKKKTKAS